VVGARWCGGGAEGLEAGRHCMRRWNFRRSEDICWIKTNKEHPSRKYLSNLNQDSKSVLVRTKVSRSLCVWV
jgi:mRNA (2'-O-methyladenosine-N6-)-methyltransferase